MKVIVLHFFVLISGSTTSLREDGLSHKRVGSLLDDRNVKNIYQMQETETSSDSRKNLNVPTLVADIRFDGEDGEDNQGMLSLAEKGEFSQLTFNHMPKCGGTFVKDILRDCVKDQSLHVIQEDQSAPPHDASQFVVGIVRNPFDYYVSLWAYSSCGTNWGTRFRNALTTQQQLDLLASKLKCFDAENAPLTSAPPPPLGTDSEDVMRFRKWLAAVNNKNVGTASMRFFYSYADNAAAHYPLGKSSFQLVDHTIEAAKIVDELEKFDSTRTCWVRTDNLVSTLRDCLVEFEAHGGDVDWAAFGDAVEVSWKNPSPHVSTSEFYDEESTKTVLHYDAALFRMFGFSHVPGKAH